MQKNPTSVAKSFLRQHDLSTAQIDILRYAARKYNDFYGHNKEQLHNGQVNEYGTRQETLNILKERGLIERGHKVNGDPERNQLKLEMAKHVHEAFELAKNDPYKVLPDASACWVKVLIELRLADSIRTQLNQMCWLITDVGRKIAVEFKQIIGAEEE